MIGLRWENDLGIGRAYNIHIYIYLILYRSLNLSDWAQCRNTAIRHNVINGVSLVICESAHRHLSTVETARSRQTEATTVQCLSRAAFVEDAGEVSVLASSRSISRFGDSVVARKERKKERKKEKKKRTDKGRERERKSACALQDTVNLHRATSVYISLRIDFCKEVISIYIYYIEVNWT